MRTTLFILAVQLGVCLPAQTFDRNYGHAFPWTEITAGRTLENGSGYCTLYHQDEGNTYNAYITFQAIDLNGDTLFTRRILDTQHPASVLGFEPSRTSTDMFGSGLKQNFVPLPFTHGFLVRYNDQGDSLWYREYSNSDLYYNFMAGLNMVVDSNDWIIQLGSTTHDIVAPYNDQPAQIYLMKTDAQGNRLWDHTYGNPVINEQPQDHVQLPDGGYLLVGYYQVLNQQFLVDHVVGWLLRTDSIGNELAYTELSDPYGITFITPSNNGHFIIGGGYSDTCCGVRSAGFVACVDQDANVLWNRVYYGPDSLDYFKDGVELSDGTLLLCGEASLDPASYDQAGWVMKTDANGNMLWQRFIDKTPTYDSFTRITACSDGGILLTGQMQRDQLSDVWLVKIDSLGCDSAGCPEDIHTGVTPVVTSSECDKGDELMAIPNPSNGHLQLRGAWLSGLHSAQVEILDATGRLVFSKEVEANEAGMLDVGLTDQPTGLYIATVRTMTGDISTVRIAIQR
jgi:hypothetical protein